MSQSNLRELAQEGNPEAIAILINRSLQRENIAVQVFINDDHLQVFFDGEQVPPKEKTYSFMKRGLENLKPITIKRVSLYGRQIGRQEPEWEQQFVINQVKRAELNSAESIADQVRTVSTSKTSKPEVSTVQEEENLQSNNSVYCPNCGSSHLQLRRDTNVSWGRAAVGWALFGTIGGAVGAVTGEDRNAIACLNCGTTWRAKDLYQTREAIRKMTGKTLNLSKESDRVYINCFLSEVGPYLENLEKAKKNGDKLIKDKETELDKDLSEGVANGCSWSVGLVVVGLLTITSGGLLLIPIAISLPFILPALGKLKDGANRESRQKQVDIAKEEARKLIDAAEKELQLKVLGFTEIH